MHTFRSIYSIYSRATPQYLPPHPRQRKKASFTPACMSVIISLLHITKLQIVIWGFVICNKLAIYARTKIDIEKG